MIRSAVVVLAVVAPTALASAQVFNPATPVVPSPPLPSTSPPAMQPIPPVLGKSSASDQGAAQPRIKSGSPSRETHNDRSIRCAHQAGALGVAPGVRGQYVAECVNN